MNIQMLETRRGSEDGFAVRCFQKDACYYIADTLARAFISAGWAVETQDDSLHYEDISMYNPDLKNRLLSRITAPAAEPLTLSETNSYLRVDHTDEDSL